MDLALRSSHRPSDSATICLPFCTVALFPSISKRYSPDFNSDFPSFAACAMLMVLLNGFANAGTASATAASKAILRTNEFVFMRVNFLSSRIESAAQRAVIGQRELLTRKRRAGTLAGQDTYSSWTNGRKDCVS